MNEHPDSYFYSRMALTVALFALLLAAVALTR